MASSPTSAPPPTSSLTPPESSTPPPNVTANPPTSPASAPPPPNVTASPPTSPASAPPPPNVTANPPTSPASAPPPPNVTASPPTSPASAPPPPNVTANPPTSPASAPPPPNVTANPPTSPASAPPPPNVTANPPTSPASAPPPPNVTSNPPTSPASAPPPSNVTANPPTSPASAPPPPNVTANPPTSPASAPPPPNVAVNPPTSAPRPATPSSGSPSPPSTATPSPPSIASASPPSSGGEGGSSPPPPSDSTQGSDNGGSSSSSTGLVVGLVVGGVVLLVLLACVYIYCKGKRRDGRYYGGPSPPPTRKGDGYSGQPQNRQYNAPAPEDHAIKIPHFSPPPKQASWQPQFPSQHHPPRMFSSSGASGSSYSGSETPQHQPSPEMALGFSKSTFTFEELVRATDGFSNANLLGQGGFGYVHRGVLPNGKEVAVKQLKIGSGQGEREFQAEVEIITRVHHKHLVSLIGYCITGEKRLLVYAFVPNNTMEFHLHGKGRPTMDWSTRLKIGLGSAKGLAYLHEDCHPKIIHRDIKAANILLDYNFEAKVADFGLAKFSADDNTHVSTRVMGTFGYLAPEYASSGKLTEKSDVFSFGVILLELITGRRPVDTSDTFRDDSLVDWARPLLSRAIEDDNYAFLADPRLQHNYNTQEMAHMVACAAVCVRHSARRRPRMTQIVRVLEGDVSLDDLNEGVRPGHSTVYGSVGSSDYDSGQYNEDMKKFRKLAFSSQEYASSEYSAATSEYGQNPSSSGSEKTMKKDSKGFR